MSSMNIIMKMSKFLVEIFCILLALGRATHSFLTHADVFISSDLKRNVSRCNCKDVAISQKEICFKADFHI